MGHHGTCTDHGQFTHPGKLVDADHSPENGAIADFGMTGCHGAIGEDDIAANGRIVAYVGADQQHVIVAQSSSSATKGGSAVDRNMLSDPVIFPDPEAGRFAGGFELFVLRGGPYGAEREKLTFLANPCVAVNYDVCNQSSPVPKSDMFAHDAIWAYLDVFAELGACGDDRGWVNARRQGGRS